jgi:hypothetical protein
MAQESRPSYEETRVYFQYAVKILCTANIPGTSQTTTSVVPGVYQTAVNIHNPTDRTVRLRQKLVLGPGQISGFIEDEVEGDGLLRIDCEQIVSRFGPFIHGAEGFLIIQSPHSLDVTAIYTAGKRGGEVESMSVKQIKEREIEVERSSE